MPRHHSILLLVGYCFSSLCMPVYATEEAIERTPLLETIERAPLLETIQCELLGTDNGKLKFTIKAHAMYYYENGDVTLVGKVEIVVLNGQTDIEDTDFYTKNDTYIQAHKLTYNKQKKLCTIEGDVWIQKPSEALKLHTEQLCYHIEEESVFTEMPVTIEHKSNLLKGNGLWASKDLKQYTLKRPCGSMELEEPLVGEER